MRILSLTILLAGLIASGASKADPISDYKAGFSARVHQFAMRNRFNEGNFPEWAKHKCYLQVGIKTTVNSDGTVAEIEIAESSGLPKLDNFYKYVIENAAPFPSFESFGIGHLKQLTISRDFRMAVRSYRGSPYSRGGCDQAGMPRFIDDAIKFVGRL